MANLKKPKTTSPVTTPTESTVINPAEINWQPVTGTVLVVKDYEGKDGTITIELDTTFQRVTKDGNGIEETEAFTINAFRAQKELAKLDGKARALFNKANGKAYRTDILAAYLAGAKVTISRQYHAQGDERYDGTTYEQNCVSSSFTKVVPNIDEFSMIIIKSALMSKEPITREVTSRLSAPTLAELENATI